MEVFSSFVPTNIFANDVGICCRCSCRDRGGVVVDAPGQEERWLDEHAVPAALDASPEPADVKLQKAPMGRFWFL